MSFGLVNKTSNTWTFYAWPCCRFHWRTSVQRYKSCECNFNTGQWSNFNYN